MIAHYAVLLCFLRAKQYGGEKKNPLMKTCESARPPPAWNHINACQAFSSLREREGGKERARRSSQGGVDDW